MVVPAAPASRSAYPQPTDLMGQTRDEMVAIMGQPRKVVSPGSEQIYLYKHLKVTFKDGKVVNVE
jgi:hypothetical protein